ncbi:unnamed protein product [Haemonchus placei]|uniref:Secreted mucin n=1 Tax=Haemonchus placei TaxID=6290 RepID=A0A0N4XBH1_HAEPC|nr:unnamed protein product [Haemonchus placei]
MNFVIWFVPAVGRATVVTRSVTIPPPIPVYIASVTNESASVKPSETATIMFLACPVPNTQTVVASTANSRQPSLAYRPNLSKSSTSLKQEEGVNTINASYGRSSQLPFVLRTDITKKPTALESANNSSTRGYRTTTTTSLRALSTKDPLRLAGSEHSTTTVEDAAITMSSETISQWSFTHDATITNRSTALKYPRRPHTSTDADNYYAGTVGTSQFVTPVTNATNITSDTMDTEEAVTTTDAATVITRSKAMPQSSTIFSDRIGRKSTTLAKKTSTSTDVGALTSSTESVSRLRSYGDVYEKQYAKSTKGKGAVTSE